MTSVHRIQASRFSFLTTIKQASHNFLTARSIPCVWHCHVIGTLSGVSWRAHLLRTEGGGRQRLCQGLRLPVHQLGHRLNLHVQARRHELPREAASPLRPLPDAAGDDVDCAISLRVIFGCRHRKQQHLRLGEAAFDVRVYDSAPLPGRTAAPVALVRKRSLWMWCQ